jgi:hypothetical protein
VRFVDQEDSHIVISVLVQEKQRNDESRELVPA